jgi:hypothetical protein
MRGNSLTAFCTVFFIILGLPVLLSLGCIKLQANQPANTQNPGSIPAGQATSPSSQGERPGGLLQGSQPGQSTVTYGAYALWTGKWETTFFIYGGQQHKAIWDLKQVESAVTGTYDWDNGKLDCRQSKTSGLMSGTWSEAPSYKPPDDAGDIELQQSVDGNSFTGKWRYGSTGDWVGEWNGKRIR